MDLSWEAMWQNHRRQLEDDVASLDALIAALDSKGDVWAPGSLKYKRDGLSHALNLMDEAERARGPRA